MMNISSQIKAHKEAIKKLRKHAQHDLLSSKYLIIASTYIRNGECGVTGFLFYINIFRNPNLIGYEGVPLVVEDIGEPDDWLSVDKFLFSHKEVKKFIESKTAHLHGYVKSVLKNTLKNSVIEADNIPTDWRYFK